MLRPQQRHAELDRIGSFNATTRTVWSNVTITD
jgi:hypothetical protein